MVKISKLWIHVLLQLWRIAPLRLSDIGESRITPNVLHEVKERAWLQSVKIYYCVEAEEAWLEKWVVLITSCKITCLSQNIYSRYRSIPFPCSS